MAIGPVSCGMPKTAFPSGDTCPQVQSTKFDLASFAPYCEMSAKPSVATNEGRKSYSICTTSGAPDPALSTLCSFWYSAGPPPTLFTSTFIIWEGLLELFYYLIQSDYPGQNIDGNLTVLYFELTIVGLFVVIGLSRHGEQRCC